MSSLSKIAIIGTGNILLSDDGAGVIAVRHTLYQIPFDRVSLWNEGKGFPYMKQVLWMPLSRHFS